MVDSENSTHMYQLFLENAGTFETVPDCYRNQEMCDKAVDNYPHALEFFPEYYETQKNL